MNRDNYIESLRSELLDLVEEHLSPVALRYGYSEVPLEANIKSGIPGRGYQQAQRHHQCVLYRA